MGTIFNRDDDEKEGTLHFRPGFMDKKKKGDPDASEEEFGNPIGDRKSVDDDVLDLDSMLDDADAQAYQQDGGEIII